MKLRYHGNGFIQVDLNERTRMHIYTPNPEFPKIDNARIHDHKFWFMSRVLHGTLHNAVYKVNPDGDKHDLFIVDDQLPNEPLRHVSSCDVELDRIDNVLTGQDYMFGGPGAFHDTFSDELVITVMTKTRAVSNYPPYVIALNKQPPQDAFEWQPPQELMRHEFKVAMSVLGDYPI